VVARVKTELILNVCPWGSAGSRVCAQGGASLDCVLMRVMAVRLCVVIKVWVVGGPVHISGGRVVEGPEGMSWWQDGGRPEPMLWEGDGEGRVLRA
jgi:hypothetical protein